MKKGGLNPRVHLIIACICGVLLSAFLYSRPKFVVKNEENGQVQSASSLPKEEVHQSLTEAQQSELSKLRAGTSKDLNLTLSDFFAQNQIFDSAAYYAELQALQSPSENSWIQSADLYYQAFSLSLHPSTKAELAEKTRNSYQKVLEINPRNLHAKTNSAMTFVNSETPMQAIMGLRQVLSENPKYIPAIMSMGALSMQSGQYDKALERFRQVLALDPTNLNAELGLAYSLIETNNKAQAKEILERLSKQNIDKVLLTEINKTLESLK